MDSAQSPLSETPQIAPKKRGPKPKAGLPVKPRKAPRWPSRSFPLTVGSDDFAYWDIPLSCLPNNPKFYLPLPFDLVKIHVSGGRVVIGWWTGGHWFSHRKVRGEVVGWSRENVEF